VYFWFPDIVSRGGNILFFKVITTEEALEIVRGFGPVEEVTVPVSDATSLYLSRDIISPEELPGFYRTTVDGYAVKAQDTFGATESLPAFLEITGESLMGEIPDITVLRGKAIRISTGGMLPEGADGVVMLEYCHNLDKNTIEISRAISPLENVISPGDDIKKGSIAFNARRKMRPQDIGLLAGLGITEVPVFRRPRVAIISTGDEIVPIENIPGPGKVRDINSYTLEAFCREQGSEPVMLGLCRDDFKELRGLIEKGLAIADTIWISGGSSVGVRDMTLKVLESFDHMELLAHGISISPGKPTIIAKVGNRAVFGLPGHAASAMVVAEVFLKVFIRRLLGRNAEEVELNRSIKACMSRNVESKSGRDDFIRVRIERDNNILMAIPIFGKSGLISTLVDAHGLVRIDRNSEGLYQGQTVDVMLFNN
jgi:molybdopterin molybdotransferase